MAMDIFSENPRSFKMDRKSHLASQLKSSISDKLLQFLGDHTDDVLAEYIVVLVCNRKHQHQARDDLEAFLGERSGEFVSWLWDVLSKTIYQSHAPSGSLNLKEVIVRRASDDDTCDEHMICNVKEPEFDPSVCGRNAKELSTQLSKKEIIRKSRFAEVCHHETLKHGSSRVKGSSENSSGGEQIMQNMEHKKTVNGDHNELLHLHQYSPKRELSSKNSQRVMTEDPHPRLHSLTKVTGSRLSLRATDPVPKQNPRPRGSVWDRLGKQCEDTKFGRSKEIEVRGIDVTRKILAHNDEHGQHEQGFPMTCSPNYANNSGIKRQFSEIDPGVATVSVSMVHGNYRRVQVQETFEESESLSSVNCSRSLNYVVSEIRKSYDEAVCHPLKSPDVLLDTRANSVSQTKSTRMASETTPNVTLVSDNSPSIPESGSTNNEGDVNSSLKPVESEVSDVKFRLHQIESKTSELRSKQVEMTHDDQITYSLSTGVTNHSEEDSKLRTVFVTNVHFAATKEALSLHFAKCGVVLRVIILRDFVTGLPKGSAYIIFASKESAEKAVALSGSSFLSRTLKVVRKTEEPVVTPSAVQLTGKPFQSWFLQHIKRNVNHQRPYSSSHLQWRRDKQVNADQPVSNSTQGGSRLEGSESSIEHNGVDSSTGQMHSRSLTYVRTTQESQAAIDSLKTSTAA